MDLVMSYDEASHIVDCKDFDGFLEHLESLCGFKLFQVSTEWYELGDEYICKAKGEKGDIVVRWES